MTIRQNLCPNPACGANVTGWTGSSAPTQITGLTGFPVTTGADYSAGSSFVQSPAAPTGLITPGGTYTLSMYVRNNNGLAANNKTLFLAWKRSAGGDDFSTTTLVNLPANSITRVEITGVAVALANSAYLVLDGMNAVAGVGDRATAALYEAVAGPAGTYFDGNSANSTWDGTPHNSTSTFNDAGGTTPVQSTLTAKWRVYGKVSTSLTGKWAVFQKITSSLRSLWNVFVNPPTSGERYLAMQRRMTQALINDDPTTAQLIPRNRTETATGGYSFVDAAPRVAQTFKLSLLASDQRPTITVGGVERTMDFHLIGPWDMSIEVNDYWVDAEGTKYIVGGFTEGWDYMTKAQVFRHIPKEANP